MEQRQLKAVGIRHSGYSPPVIVSRQVTRRVYTNPRIGGCPFRRSQMPMVLQVGVPKRI
jgi:hypothetical protein